MRNSKQIQVQEIGGDQSPDLASAQAHALPALASDLAATVRTLLADGLLINVNGRIIPNPERSKQ